MIELARQFGRYGYRRIAALNGSGDERVEKFRRSNRRIEDFGLMTDYAFGCVLRIGTMSGVVTSFIAEPMMAKPAPLRKARW